MPARPHRFEVATKAAAGGKNPSRVRPSALLTGEARLAVVLQQQRRQAALTKQFGQRQVFGEIGVGELGINGDDAPHAALVQQVGDGGQAPGESIRPRAGRLGQVGGGEGFYLCGHRRGPGFEGDRFGERAFVSLGIFGHEVRGR